jgi:hypothetical protein
LDIYSIHLSISNCARYVSCSGFSFPAYCKTRHNSDCGVVGIFPIYFIKSIFPRNVSGFSCTKSIPYKSFCIFPNEVSELLPSNLCLRPNNWNALT